MGLPPESTSSVTTCAALRAEHRRVQCGPAFMGTGNVRTRDVGEIIANPLPIPGVEHY